MSNAKEIYSNIELSTDVMSASNHRLIQLMFNKCLQHIEMAKSHILNNEPLKKAQAISKGMDIVDYLRMCLNHENEQARELSRLLESLYGYMQKHLIQATLHNDIESLDEAKKILSQLKEGWDQIKS